MWEGILSEKMQWPREKCHEECCEKCLAMGGQGSKESASKLEEVVPSFCTRIAAAKLCKVATDRL